MFVIAAAADASASGALALGGLVMMAMTVVFLIISIVWLVFPFIVHHHLKELRRLQQNANYYLQNMAEEVKAASVSSKGKAPPPPPI